MIIQEKKFALQSIKNWGLIVICENYESCVELSNNFAPEHLEILTLDSKKILAGIENAGAIFLGKWTPEAVGDYSSWTKSYVTHIRKF